MLKLSKHFKLNARDQSIVETVTLTCLAIGLFVTTKLFLILKNISGENRKKVANVPISL